MWPPPVRGSCFGATKMVVDVDVAVDVDVGRVVHVVATEPMSTLTCDGLPRL